VKLDFCDTARQGGYFCCLIAAWIWNDCVYAYKRQGLSAAVGKGGLPVRGVPITKEGVLHDPHLLGFRTRATTVHALTYVLAGALSPQAGLSREEKVALTVGDSGCPAGDCQPFGVHRKSHIRQDTGMVWIDKHSRGHFTNPGKRCVKRALATDLK